MTVAKRISLKPLSQAVEAIQKLINMYNKTCASLNEEDRGQKRRKRCIKSQGNTSLLLKVLKCVANLVTDSS